MEGGITVLCMLCNVSAKYLWRMSITSRLTARELFSFLSLFFPHFLLVSYAYLAVHEDPVESISPLLLRTAAQSARVQGTVEGGMDGWRDRISKEGAVRQLVTFSFFFFFSFVSLSCIRSVELEARVIGLGWDFGLID